MLGLAVVVGCGSPAPRATAVDSVSLYRSTLQVAQTCLKVVALRDTLDLERQQRRMQAAARLDPRVRDSLREARWMRP